MVARDSVARFCLHILWMAEAHQCNKPCICITGQSFRDHLPPCCYFRHSGTIEYLFLIETDRSEDVIKTLWLAREAAIRADQQTQVERSDDDDSNGMFCHRVSLSLI
jgi:hypothetical protein